MRPNAEVMSAQIPKSSVLKVNALLVQIGRKVKVMVNHVDQTHVVQTINF